jgi:hypothetical protein
MMGSLRLDIGGDHHAHRRFQSAERATMASDQEIAAPPNCAKQDSTNDTLVRPESEQNGSHLQIEERQAPATN